MRRIRSEMTLAALSALAPPVRILGAFEAAVGVL